MPTAISRAFARAALATAAATALATAVVSALAPTAAAQASPYIPLDDPRLPLLEHLIARGDVADPSPFVRPFRRADAARILATADTTGPSAALIAQLRAAFEAPADGDRWRVEARAGGQAYTHARRDPLHPDGKGGVMPYADLRLEGIFDRVIAVTRPALEPRVIDDPDWLGRKDLDVSGRMVEAYLSAQWSWGSVFYGQMDHNWGPTGLPGIGLSDYGYSRTVTALDIGNRIIRLHAQATALRDDIATDGERIHRYFFAHRLGLHLSERLQLGLWETTVLAGAERNFDGRFRNPLSLLLLANQYGQGDDGGNVLIGVDARWRAFGRTTLEAQLGIDDIQYQHRSGPDRYPDRVALALAARGPLGGTLGWQALYTRASSLAFRTLNASQNFTEGGVGLGRNFADLDQLTVRVTAPLRGRWLASPELTLLRQGEGRINDPFPPTREEAGRIPQIFVGTMARTWRMALALSGREGPFDVQGDVGYHHIENADHVEGATDDRVEARIQVTVGLFRGGTFR